MTYRARRCPICGKPVALTRDGRIRWHRDTRERPGAGPVNPACAGAYRLPDDYQPGAARAMTDTSTETLLHIEEFTPIHGFPTGHARCGADDGLLATNSGAATCEKCIEWEPDENDAEAQQ